MQLARLELLIEPFAENAPGLHVTAAIDILEATGLAVEMGPFSTTVDGHLDQLTALAPQIFTAAFSAGATSVQMLLERQ
ncbi:MAG: hypothetical protein ACI8TP_000712 [Acidimicrobiales bacterium]|jgi:uncharacterized protein YqgV (UPF0045/DUF77 family)